MLSKVDLSWEYSEAALSAFYCLVSTADAEINQFYRLSPSSLTVLVDEICGLYNFGKKSATDCGEVRALLICQD